MNNLLSSVIVIYFSATGTTANVAQNLATVLNAPIYEIRPAQPYTAADLNWNDEQSRSSLEMDGKIPYPELADLNAPVKDYDVIFLGFPIWWGTAPKIVNKFVQSYDLSGKKVVLFATSGSSGLGDTASDLQMDATGNPEFITGGVLNGNPNTERLKNFVSNLKL